MWNPIDHMNAARANKPASGGKTYATPRHTQSSLNAKYPAESLDRIEYEYTTWVREWQYAALAAVETALFAHEWEGLGF